MLSLFTFVFSVRLIVGQNLSFNLSEVVEESSLASSRPVQIYFVEDNFALPVIPTSIQNGAWPVHDSVANFLLTSASPTQNSNIVIYGHNTRDALWILKRLKTGEEIVLTSESGSKYTYKVDQIFVTNPEDVAVVMPTDQEILTLYTCTGLFDQKRLVVRAKPV